MKRALSLLVLLAAAASLSGAAPALEKLPDAAAVKKAVTPNGKPLLVHAWASWCGPCMEEMPRMVAVAKKAKAAGAEVIFLNADGFENAELAQAALQKAKATDVARQLQLPMEEDIDKICTAVDPQWDGLLPATFVFDASGALVKAVHGTAKPKELEAMGKRAAELVKKK